MRPGRSVSACAADVVAVSAGAERAGASTLATLMALSERVDLSPGT